MSEHTPGPWTIFFVDGISTIFPAGRPGEVADNIASEADAYLIAAAPDLLAALKEMVEEADSVSRERGWPLASRFDKARAAIAKAEGKP